MEKFELSREELYELVWVTPLTKLSKQFNLSDNGLRKICIKYDVPLPKSGHWQKIQHGKVVEIPKLIMKDKWADVKIEFRSEQNEHPLSKLARITKEIEEELTLELIVPERLSNPCVIIREARADLNLKKSTTHRGFKTTISTSNNKLSISVTKENVPRALRIMDTFIKVSLARGHQIEIEGTETVYKVNGENYKIRFREKHTRQNVNDGRWRTSELVPNGVLSLKLDTLFSKEWQDGKILLESQIAKIIASFEIRAEDDKKERAEREVYWADQKKKQKIKDDELARERWELSKVDLLLEHAKSWSDSQSIKTFLNHIQSSADFKKDHNEWMEWAIGEYERMNPLTNGTDEFISKYEYPDKHG